MKLLDSTFLIDFARKKIAAREKLESLEHQTLYTTRINIFEVLTGLFSLKSETERAIKLSEIQIFFNRLTIMELDETSSVKAAEISGALNKSGSSVDSADCLIAGIALSNGINTIVTRNARDFEKREGIKVESY